MLNGGRAYLSEAVELGLPYEDLLGYLPAPGLLRGQVLGAFWGFCYQVHFKTSFYNSILLRALKLPLMA